MFEEPPQPPAEAPPASAEAAGEAPAATLYAEEPDGTLVIDLTKLVPAPPAEECAGDASDPFNSEIVVCDTTAAPSPRLGPMVGPVDDGFGSAIPRARIKLSDKASAEANVHNSPVGGFNANGGEVRLKIGF